MIVLIQRHAMNRNGPYVLRRRLALGRLVIDYLLDHPCIDCGCDDVRVLEFDHRDPATKVAGVCELVNQLRSWALIADEIAQCDVRCRNCHVIRTHEVNDSWRHRVWTELMVAGRV